MYCAASIDTDNAYQIPISMSADGTTFETYGNCCSPECVKTYVVDSTSVHCKGTILNLLSIMLRTKHRINHHIKLLPPRHLLRPFGGNIEVNDALISTSTAYSSDPGLDELERSRMLPIVSIESIHAMVPTTYLERASKGPSATVTLSKEAVNPDINGNSLFEQFLLVKKSSEETGGKGGNEDEPDSSVTLANTPATTATTQAKRRVKDLSTAETSKRPRKIKLGTTKTHQQTLDNMGIKHA